jgi:hypothetical protein
VTRSEAELRLWMRKRKIRGYVLIGLGWLVALWAITAVSTSFWYGTIATLVVAVTASLILGGMLLTGSIKIETALDKNKNIL